MRDRWRILSAHEDFRIKLERADEHLQTVRVLLAEFLDSGPYSVISEPDPSGTGKLLRGRVPREPLPGWSAVIGDCLHNLRSALDNLAYRLAGSAAGRQTEFPVFRNQTLFNERTKAGHPTRRSGLAKMTGMSTGAQTTIKGLQPYNRPNRLPSRFEPLWLLQCLDIEDKHHALVLIAGAMEKAVVRLPIGTPDLPFTASYTSLGVQPFKDGDILGRYPAPVGVYARRGEVMLVPEYKPEVTFYVAFDPRGPAAKMPVLKVLGDCRMAVEEAILKLNQYL